MAPDFPFLFIRLPYLKTKKTDYVKSTVQLFSER
jgi:hypothetical protein